MRSMTQSLVRADIKRLGARLPVFKELVGEFGIVKPWWREPGFEPLVLMILEQQISIASARAVFNRLESSAGAINPEALLALGDAGIRDAGVTRQKAGYCLGLAEAVVSGDLDFDALSSLPEADALAALTRLKGIGEWTAEVYLITALRRRDIFPAGDRALVVAVAEFDLMPKEPDFKALRKFAADHLAPERSAAAWQLWHAYLKKRGRVAPEP